MPKKIKEASVPKKCNVLIIINNKYITCFYTNKDKLYGAMIPQERGLEGLSIFFYILNTHFVLMENISYMSFLGEGHVVFYFQELYKPIFGLFGGFFNRALVH